MSRLLTPDRVLVFGLGSLFVPVLELVVWRLLDRDPFNPTPFWRKLP